MDNEQVWSDAYNQGYWKGRESKNVEIQKQQAEIDELVDILDELYYGNRPDSWAKAKELIAKHKEKE